MRDESTPGMAEVTAAESTFRLDLSPEADLVPRLCTLMHKGCYVKVITGCSLRELLCDQFGIDPEYVRKDIKVFFINSSPVDNIDEAIIRDGATVALSASMPGLVGAAMRGDGLSWMRSSITYKDEGGGSANNQGVIQLKLFNQVMADLGKEFLERGVYVKSQFFLDFLGRFGEEFWAREMGILGNGDSLSRADLCARLASWDGMVSIRVRQA